MSSEKKIKVVISDSDKLYVWNLKKSIVSDDDIEVVSTATTGEETLMEIIQSKPDIVVLDILLPQNDGLWVLEELERRNITNIGIITTLNFKDYNISKMAMELGSTYLLIKPFSEICLKHRIRQVYKILIGGEECKVLEKESEIKSRSQPYSVADLEIPISDLVMSFGISPSLQGYYYIKAAVIMLLQEEKMISITKSIYPDVANLYKVTATTVERSIRHAIDSSWDEEIYSKHLGFKIKKRPTNGQFLANVAEIIRLRHMI